METTTVTPVLTDLINRLILKTQNGEIVWNETSKINQYLTRFKNGVFLFEKTDSSIPAYIVEILEDSEIVERVLISTVSEVFNSASRLWYDIEKYIANSKNSIITEKGDVVIKSFLADLENTH